LYTLLPWLCGMVKIAKADFEKDGIAYRTLHGRIVLKGWIITCKLSSTQFKLFYQFKLFETLRTLKFNVSNDSALLHCLILLITCAAYEFVINLCIIIIFIIKLSCLFRIVSTSCQSYSQISGQN